MVGAVPGDLKRLAAAVAPKRLIRIHTFERDQFPRLLITLQFMTMANGSRLSGRVFTNGSAKFDLGKLAKQA